MEIKKSLNETFIISTPLITPSQADCILFGENHTMSWQRRVFSRIVDDFVVPNSVLLMESCPALEVLKEEDQKRILESLNISEKAKSQLTVMGWDYLNLLPKSPQTLNEDSQYFRSRKELLDFTAPSSSSQSIAERYNLAKRVESLFPKRTAAMADTLLALQALRENNKLNGMIFVLAGLQHVQRGIPSPLHTNLTLDPLYEQLSQMRALVVKPLKSGELD